MDLLIRVGSHHQRIDGRELVDRLANVSLSNLIGLLSIENPELDECIPSCRYKKYLVIDIERVDVFHWSTMLSNLNRLTLRVVWIPHLDRRIRMSDKDRTWLLVSLLLLLGAVQSI